MTTVLVVNDDMQIQKLIETVLDYLGSESIRAYSLAGAEVILADPRGIDVVLWDANLGDGMSYELIARVRPNFDGLMVAASADPFCRRQQMLAGCDRELVLIDLMSHLEQILKPQTQAS